MVRGAVEPALPTARRAVEVVGQNRSRNFSPLATGTFGRCASVGTMASQSSKSYTAPKGRVTTNRGSEERRRRLSPTMEWVLLILAAIIILGVIIYFGRDIAGGGGGGHNGAAVIQMVSSFT